MSDLNIDYKTKESFFEILLFFKNANYNQKVDFMKKHWGNVVASTTITYPDGCSITIRFDENNKYYFDFECSNLPFVEFEKFLPQYAEALTMLGTDGVVKEFSELKELALNEIKDEDIQEQAVDSDIELSQSSLDSAYLNIYNGVNFVNKSK